LRLAKAMNNNNHSMMFELQAVKRREPASSPKEKTAEEKDRPK
jgi:hypothetical protein